MRRLMKALFWIFIFVLLLVGMDRLLTQIPPVHPAHAAVSDFYRDFRARLFAVIVIPGPDDPQTVEAVIEQEQRVGAKAPAPTSRTEPAAQPGSQRFVYVDAQGVLQFADSREAVPAAYRDSAEPLAE